MSTKLRPESRPRSNRTSPSTTSSNKQSSEKVGNECSKISTIGLLTRSRSSSNTKEECKKATKTFSTCPSQADTDRSNSNSTIESLAKEPFRNTKNPTRNSRLSTTSLPFPSQMSANNNADGIFQDSEAYAKPQSNAQIVAHRGRLSTGSLNILVSNATKYAGDSETINSRMLKRRKEQYLSNEVGVSAFTNQTRSEAPNNLSTSLLKRLSLLEGKVSKVVSEIQKARERLTSDELTESADALVDIADKIANMEKSMSYNEINMNANCKEMKANTENQLQLHKAIEKAQAFRLGDLFNAETKLESLQHPIVSEHEFGLRPRYGLLYGSVSAPPKVSRLVYDLQQHEAIVYNPRVILRDLIPSHGTITDFNTADLTLLQNTKFSHVGDPIVEVRSDKCCGLAKEQVAIRKPFSPEKMYFNGINCMRYPESRNEGESIHEENLHEDSTSNQSQVQNGCTLAPLVQTEEMKDALECSESPLSDSAINNVENIPPDDGICFDVEEYVPNQLHPIGNKIATAGWYVSDGEAILLAHDDGSCSYYDVANMDEKSIYAAPSEMNSTLWNDCWLIRAAGSDGRSNKYIVAATSGSSLDCGFCSWDFSCKSLVAFHTENQCTPPRGSSPGSPIQRSRNLGLHLSSTRSSTDLPSSAAKLWSGEKDFLARSKMQVLDTIYHSANTYRGDCCDPPQWWYGPCGPLMASAASSVKGMVLYDIRDGEAMLSWELDQPIASLEYTNPLQWRDKGKLALVEDQAISVWDVNTMDMQCLQYVQLLGKHISAIHVHNRDAECSGGVRQRLSSSETEAYDGVCCTQNDIIVLDFRVSSGIGISFPVSGQSMQSVYTRGDMIFVGSLNKESHECGVQQWSLRKGLPVRACAFPASGCHYTHLALKQVWGSSRMVMAVNGNGLFMFHGWKEPMESLCEVEEVKDIIGTQDLLNPSFDYSNSRVLLISKDREASWSYWPHHWGMA
ncbi:hypothetical protein KP509_39G029600 [Ceratopteris richardii]|nr:hypothetical protein KP509_39G029600 [Ceratopteris richardii]